MARTSRVGMGSWKTPSSSITLTSLLRISVSRGRRLSVGAALDDAIYERDCTTKDFESWERVRRGETFRCKFWLRYRGRAASMG